jgi:predicted GTPase
MCYCSAILSATQSDALAQLQAKLDTILASVAAQSTVVQSGLRNVVETVKTLPYIAATVEKISEKVDRLVLGTSRSSLF